MKLNTHTQKENLKLLIQVLQQENQVSPAAIKCQTVSKMTCIYRFHAIHACDVMGD